MKKFHNYRWCFTLIVVSFLLMVALQNTSLVIASSPFSGNVKSKIFHKTSCRYYDCKQCVKYFDTREEAVNEGYRPCKVCKP